MKIAISNLETHIQEKEKKNLIMQQLFSKIESANELEKIQDQISSVERKFKHKLNAKYQSKLCKLERTVINHSNLKKNEVG